MSNLVINNLEMNQELDAAALVETKGGRFRPKMPSYPRPPWETIIVWNPPQLPTGKLPQIPTSTGPTFPY